MHFSVIHSLIHTSCPSIHLSTYISVAPTGWISVKSVKKIQRQWNTAKISGTSKEDFSMCYCCQWHPPPPSSSSLAYHPYSLTSDSFSMIAHTDLSSAFFHHLRQPLIWDYCQYSLTTLILVSLLFFFHLVSPRNIFFMHLSSDILTAWPAHSSLLDFIVVTLFSFLHITCNSSLVQIIQPFWSCQLHYITTKALSLSVMVSGC